MKNFYSLILLTLFSSCMTLNDSWEDLGNDYTLHRDGKWSKIYGKSVYKNTDIYSNIVDHEFDEDFIIVKQNPDKKHHKIFIRSNYQTRFSIYEYYLKDSTAMFKESTPETISAMKSDSKFHQFLKSKGVTNQNSTKDWEIIDGILDSVFVTEPFYIKLFSSTDNYWIIDKKNDQRYGPLTNEEFIALSKELDNTLIFKN